MHSILRGTCTCMCMHCAYSTCNHNTCMPQACRIILGELYSSIGQCIGLQAGVFLKDTQLPIWASLRAARAELHRDIHAVYLGHSQFLAR